MQSLVLISPVEWRILGDYRSLVVWQRAHKLVLRVYVITKSFPPEERFALAPQMRRAAASIPANLAEGSGRDSDRELVRYSRIALGSATELDYFVTLAADLAYISDDDARFLHHELDEVKRMLASLASSLAARTRPKRRLTTDD